MPGFSFGEVRQEYETLWSSMKISVGSLADVDKLVRGIVQGKPRYDHVSHATGVRWYVVGIIHALEASLNFKSRLHNGDPLTDRTVQVPRGRPPFGIPPFEWEDSAIDALTSEDLDDMFVCGPSSGSPFNSKPTTAEAIERGIQGSTLLICGASPATTQKASLCATACSTPTR